MTVMMGSNFEVL